MASEKMRGFGGLLSLYYLQLLLAGDSETRRKPALFLSQDR